MRHRSLSALFGALALSACVSIDDRKLTEHDGKPGDAGEAGESQGGTGGSSGSATGGTDTGGAAGEGGASGKGGTSTTGGSAGKGGTAGQGGSGALGPTEDCAGDPLAVDEEVVRACLLQVGCNPFVPSTSLSFCITNQRLNTFPQDDCGTGAMDCEDFLACRGQGYYRSADCTSGAPVYCETETLGVACARYPYAIDCEKFGGVCDTYTDASGGERVWCRIPELDGCTEPAGMDQCSASGVSYTCIGGSAFGNDCPLIGSECRDGACYYVLPACTTPGATCGTAARLDLCYASLDVARYACAGGLACAETSASAGCVAPGCALNEPCAESCSGTELTFCYGGVPVTLDCTDYGFRRCLESTPSDGGDPLAYCAFPDTAIDRICEVEDTDNTCGACAKTECCPAWTACLDNPDCVDYINCASDCEGVSTCIDACDVMYPLGVAGYDAFFACRDAACGC